MNNDFDVYVTKEQLVKWTGKALEKDLDFTNAQWSVHEAHDGPHGTLRVQFRNVEVIGD